MDQYFKQFGTCRVPGSPADTLVTNASSNHIIVLVMGQIFKLDVYTPNGDRVGGKELQRALYDITREALTTNAPNDLTQNLGFLTAGPRDTWADAYAQMAQDPVNAASFKAIHESLFVVCLDDYSSGTEKQLDKTHKQIFHNGNASNRW